jgi:tripartite-type tricarboxylate transporter receptor subunit TctC
MSKFMCHSRRAAQRRGKGTHPRRVCGANRFIRSADAPRLGGPVKPGHDKFGWVAGVIAAAVIAFVSGSASAADSQMFSGKTVTYIVAVGPGGGYDTYGRLVARYMQKHLPGSRFIVRNVPGAGHIVGANTLYASKPDGLTIGTFNTGLIYDQLMQREGVLFDLKKFGWIGKAAADSRALLIATNSGFKSFDALRQSKQPVKFAASGVGAADYVETRIIADALHINAQIIPGFTGNAGEMSMLRQEVAAKISTLDAMEDFIKAKHGFWALSLTEDASVLPGVPRAMSYAKDERMRRLLTLVETLSEIGRLTAAPPNVPRNILDTERRAYDAAVKDPEFLAEAKKLQLPISPATGEVVEAKIMQALNQPPETVTLLKAAAGVK